MEKFFKKSSEPFWAIFRIVVGILFFVHGAQKIFGWFGSKGAVDILTKFGFAGTVEIIVGLFLVIGLFTRYAALLGIVDMIGAYFLVHINNGVFPWQNGGELPLLYLAAFLAIISKGTGIWSMDKR